MITAPIPTAIAAPWIYSRLAADSQLVALVGTRIRPEDMDEGDAYPVVLYQFQSGIDEGCIGSPDNVMDVNCVYLIKAITKGGSFKTTEAILARIDAALNNEAGSVSEGSVIYCRREQAHVRSEVLTGDKYRHLGFTYRIRVQS